MGARKERVSGRCGWEVSWVSHHTDYFSNWTSLQTQFHKHTAKLEMWEYKAITIMACKGLSYAISKIKRQSKIFVDKKYKI
jgi:hypothetical protein